MTELRVHISGKAGNNIQVLSASQLHACFNNATSERVSIFPFQGEST